MSFDIIIDDPALRPNVRPEVPPSRRGTLTFIASIEEPNQPVVKRNLSRGVEETDDPYRKPREDDPISVDTPIVSLEAYKLSITAGGGGLLPLALSVELVAPEDDGPFTPVEDTFAIGGFDHRIRFSLPENMVTTADDAAPL